ncbi:MAG: hypothetical protein AVDCRST_MAG34-2410 [uncultured Nocardioidaceae bacterium]|uniref:DUF4386 family protein n=1 Tax=uncultured Nocardioidaceae bacterium TaxID=253824 RepID=A0A6J4MKU7_9ACTN|nr:MAG: hypothetical protein AVDCRST_MAG34-2410 [uncultured Nocardioidaceae bacterium]
MQAAALAGTATLPLVLIVSMVSDVTGSGGLNPGSSDAQLIRVFVEYRDQQLVASSLYAAAAAATLLFLGPLWARLRTGSEWLAVVAVAGGVAAGFLWLLASAWSMTAVVAADYEDAGAARFLMVSGWEIARLSVAPHLVMVGAATVTGFRHGAFGRWFNVTGLGFTLLLAVGLVPFAPAGMMGMLATLWVFLASLVLAFGSPPETRPDAR